MPFFQKFCPTCFPVGSCSFLEPCPGPQSCLYNLMKGQPENSRPLGEKYCIISNPSRHSGLHLPCFLQQHLSVNTLVWVTGPQCLLEVIYIGGIISRSTGLPGIMFATLGVSPVDHLAPNTYHPSKVTNIPSDQISTLILWNIWSIASYQFVLMPLTNSYKHDPVPL